MNFFPLRTKLGFLQIEFEKVYREQLEQRPEPYYAVYHTFEPLSDIFMQAIGEMGKTYVKALITCTQPGYGVHEHVDTTRPPFYDRWHLPIYTDETILIEDGRKLIMHEGYWYGPVRFWLPHSVEPTAVERVHLIVDFEPPEMC